MLKFITNLFGAKKAEPKAPYKVEAPKQFVDGHGDVQAVVNPSTPVINGKKKSAPKKPSSSTATGNTPAKKKVSPKANKKSQPKK